MTRGTSSRTPARSARLRHADDVRPSVRPAAASADLPGTPGKVEALAGRLGQGSALFSTADVRAEDCPRLGLRPVARPVNGAAAKNALDDPDADGASTLFHALADEDERGLPPPPEEIELPPRPTYAQWRALVLLHAAGVVEVRRARKGGQ